MQNDPAQVILAMTGGRPAPIQFTPKKEASFDGSFAQAERDEFATDKELRSSWKKHFRRNIVFRYVL
jgi:hypothetical protein